MIIKKVKKREQAHIDLLTLAETECNLVSAYLKTGEIFALYDEKLMAAALVLNIDGESCEIKSIATYKDYRNKGYAKALIDYISNYYRSNYKNLIVATSNSNFSNIAFYENCGFKYYKTIDNFLLDSYTEEIFEDISQCRDILYFKKRL